MENSNLACNQFKNLYNLEALFSEATKCHPELHYLDAQWKFDKELLSKSLQNIGSFFSHYSRHDSSHSRKLITNIERILGERLKHLSATDMWLILEAAYSHDIGMVITEKQLNDLDESDFEQFLNELAEDEDSEHQETAIKLLNSDFKLGWKKSCWHEIEKFKFIIAEWFRKKHPYNSARIVLNPNDEIGLTSPRNELLPRRLFSILSKICAAHGQSFEETMELSFSETGMATENCHPRFVACLIKMADLLDIDDNRFCPVMMKASIGGLPHSSHTHVKKHHSITKFRLDSRKIQIELECPDHETLEITRQWFNWLEEEHLNQTRNWMKIVPCYELGKLPILVKTKITILPPLVLLSETDNIKYEFDTLRIKEILSSKGFYESERSVIRELIQNSFDSTLKAIWLKIKDDFFSAGLTGVDANKFLHQQISLIKDKYPIKFTIESDELTDEVVLKIVDHGIGFSLDDIRGVFRPGDKKIRKRKLSLIKDMPELIKPSGSFGIGIISYFMLSDTIDIKTTSRVTGESYNFRLSKNNNDHFIARINQPKIYKSIEFGTTISLRIKQIKYNDTSLHNRLIIRKNKKPQKFYNFDILDSNNSDFFLMANNMLKEYILNCNHSSHLITFLNGEAINSPSEFLFISKSNKCALLYLTFKSVYDVFGWSKKSALSVQSFSLFFKDQFVNLNKKFSFVDYGHLSVNLFGYDAKDLRLFVKSCGFG